MPTPQLKPLTLRDAKSGEWCTFRPQPNGWIMIPAGTYRLQNEATEPEKQLLLDTRTLGHGALARAHDFGATFMGL